ncbi:MAG: PEP-CTERM sorting domain-containing protein [Candidatus Nealsonbacteria bacterium]|nr:PEP-CTERM sorting domain-containing protein [Candidatus Nealsonbacteria bacterium]
MLITVCEAPAAIFTVNDADFDANVYDFHYYNDLNNTLVSATVINGVNQGISDPTRTNNGWYNGDQDGSGSGAVKYWKSTSSLAGDLTMAWDFSDVTGTIKSIELKTEHLIFQFNPWISHATGDQVYGQIATPSAFGAGVYTDLYRETADNLAGVTGSNSLFDVTSSVSSGWLNDPGLLELKLGYIKQNLDIPTRHIQVFRDNTGIGDDGFVLRVTLDSNDTVPEPSAILIWSLLGIVGITVGWCRRRRQAA